jgi:hypothetical protein
MRSLVVALLILSAPALAAAPKSSDAAPIAAKLAKQTLTEKRWNQMVQAMDEQMSQGFAQHGQALSAEELEKLKTEMHQLLNYQEMTDFLAGVLLKYYTADEMKQLEAFYRSPVGQKALDLQPEVMRDSMGFVQSKLAKEMPGIMQRVKGSAPAESGK